MKIKYAFFTTIALVLFLSCKEEEKKSETLSQMKEVMAIHDEVMPKMGTIGKLVSELKTKIDSTEKGIEYDKAMKDFGDRFTSDEILNGAVLTEQKQEWLNEEEKKVTALKLQINNSIENAEKLLE
ncbi:hypothetical protein [Eudoraea sp.]|uniref:hypothetical protein n=1 Tax=Eudoraea sp. TaxID=1979955 RepID=UPI003C772E1D